MPKDNEVDEKVIQRYAPNIVCDGSIDMEPSEFGTWISLSDHAATVAELRAEVIKERERADKFMWQVRDTCARAEAAERRVGELTTMIEEMREYVSDALHQEREAFKGYEHCSNIPTIEQDLKRIDGTLTGADPT